MLLALTIEQIRKYLYLHGFSMISGSLVMSSMTGDGTMGVPLLPLESHDWQVVDGCCRISRLYVGTLVMSLER